MSDGGCKSIAVEVPEPDKENNVTVEETASEVGKPNVEYPIERDHCTVTKYVKRKSYQSSSYIYRYEYKEFDIQLDQEAHPQETERIEHLIEQLQKLPSLKEQVDALDTYDELVENADLIREYEATYRLMKGIWSKDSIRPYALTYTARDFQVDQFPQGFFCVPGPHHTNVRKILDEKLQAKGIAKYSVAWGGFIVDPENFTEIFEVVEPAYHTPDIEQTLSREKLA